MKYVGMVGYAMTEKVKPGVCEEKIIEKPFCGEDTQTISRWKTNTQVNDDIDISKQISILADPFAYANFSHIRYITVLNMPDVRWKVNSVEVKYPRLILNVGGLYNGRDENRRNEET